MFSKFPLLFVITLSSSASAALLETPKQLAVRYGKPLDSAMKPLKRSQWLSSFLTQLKPVLLKRFLDRRLLKKFGERASGRNGWPG